MKHEITRDLIQDLWPLYLSNDLSSESRSLVDTFLSQDADFAAKLQASRKMSPVVPNLQLSPDQERRLLDQARERARMKLLIIGGAVSVVALLAIVALAAVIVLMFSQSA